MSVAEAKSLAAHGSAGELYFRPLRILKVLGRSAGKKAGKLWIKLAEDQTRGEAKGPIVQMEKAALID